MMKEEATIVCGIAKVGRPNSMMVATSVMTMSKSVTSELTTAQKTIQSST
jgi:hypothetical protein